MHGCNTMTLTDERMENSEYKFKPVESTYVLCFTEIRVEHLLPCKIPLLIYN